MFTLATNRLHLVKVDTQGRARLKLRPRFELNGDQRVIRIDALPTYDSPPTLDDLCREAGRKRDLERQHRDEIAEAVLKDPTRRPIRRPSPTPFKSLRTLRGRPPT